MLRKSPASNAWAAIFKNTELFKSYKSVNSRSLLELNLTKQTIKENKEVKVKKNIKRI